jgi:hypothetical protein
LTKPGALAAPQIRALKLVLLLGADKLRAHLVAAGKPKRLGYHLHMDASEMGRKGGRRRTAAKRAAARRNGARGGRPSEAQKLAREVRDTCVRLAPQFPKIDPGDLRLIVRCLLLPPSRRAVFLTRREDGRYVF